MTRIGVITFPGTLDDVDALRAVRLAGAEPVALWHKDADLRGVDGVVVPGGFSYGDYLRCGAIARFAPVMDEVIGAAGRGMPVLGICNGFQILTEAHLLPGALIRNDRQRFVCREQRLRYVGGNPNGSAHDIAGVRNGRGNVVGLMPHPEHAVEPGFGPDSEAGPRTGTDGLRLFRSVIASLVGA